MAFFYEAEPPTWKYKERYSEWQTFPKKTAQQLEKLYKKIFEKGDQSVTEYEWRTDAGQIHKINVKNMTSHNQSSYYRTSEVSREGYPYPPSGDKKKLGKLYDNMIVEGAFDAGVFFDRLRMDPAGLESLIVFAMMELESFGDIPKSKFVDNFAKCGCSSLSDITNAVTPIKNSMKQQRKKKIKVLKAFAKWLFNATKMEQRQRTQEAALLAGLLPLVCDPQYFPLATQFAEFLTACGEEEGGQRQTLSRDDWVMMIEFLGVTDSWNEYSEDMGWPLIISECAEKFLDTAEN